jgi:hypothetical protein
MFVIQWNLANSDNCLLIAHYDHVDEARCSKRTVQKSNTHQNKFIFKHGLNNTKYVGYLKCC